MKILSIEFFNNLLSLRTDCEKLKDMEYQDWYDWNFKRTNVIIKSVEKQLSVSVESKDKRAFDIWMDIPGKKTTYIDQHMKRLDK